MIKRILAVSIFLFITSSAKSDVIFFPYQYSLINYSLEFVYSYELAKKEKISTVFWGGAGTVGSFFYLDKPVTGLEVAVERRRYFKPDLYKNFFISGYIGVAYMTDFKGTKDLGLVPGFKFNYKAQLSKNLVMEPYIGLSVPITMDMNYQDFYVPFPMATIGIRLGITTLKT
ncbi:MAG: hypothetical protein JXB49_21110 [Bacteroidales bacterium]|nr:hypothetical protein [Bacteroidales bacterium]